MTTPDPSTPTEPTSPTPERLTALETELSTTRTALTHAQQQRDLDRALFTAGATDLDAAHTLAEKALTEGHDIPKAVAHVRQRTPSLFRPPIPPSPARGATLAPAAPHAPPTSDLESAQRAAGTTGDRRDLLRYLRLRRNA
ncbi:MAG TPA: hypothetical protein VHN77_02185 [Phycisphaerales bacterium]|nr:hypothetical protein [Phycisphaerales bacterium]